jgi:hypothetical protein
LVAALVEPAVADWLMTRDGAKVESNGPWEVRGAVVVFTLPNGSLSSLRLRDVDLDASDAATAKAKEEVSRTQIEDQPDRRKAILVLTDDEVAHVWPEDPTRPPLEEGSNEIPSQRIEVLNWREKENTGSDVVISGRIGNRSDDVVGSIRLGVRLLDLRRQPIASGQAALEKLVLRPGETTSFQVVLPGAGGYHGDVEFDVEHIAVETTESVPARLPSDEELMSSISPR